ncbi:mediator of RNA polymerase II transcription subunit 1 [Nymphalis io]|uniref:mediator of RNA polymerase II transcription subunit 1 n=1 Tax=Inachis io TaxID=171585 RepID=UPI00216A4493|nr:mediator of RNA polymerase II transcription subunit 1 [Nymphalis io]
MTDNKALVMANANSMMDKSKELQKEILMEKLRSKTSQYKNLSETSKAVRMAMLDKRWAVDSADRMILQKCLDSLQHCIKVSSLQSLIERLECLSRQLGLKFVVGTSGVNLFISSDMFYLEILVESSGSVKDVKIHHEGKIEQQSCEELVQCISRGDFADFTAQLEGLTAVYQLNAEKKVKCKAFSALQSLEEDLCSLRQLQSFIKEPWAQVHKSPIGFLQKRRGGHAMRLTYFVSPYELLDKDKGLQPLTVELLTLGKQSNSSGLASLVAVSHTPIGQSATVLLEGSAANKLQLSPIISGGQRPGKGSGPVYAPLVPQNSAMLPACFTLKLSQPTPLCSGLAKLIHATTEVEVAGDWANAKPMLGLVAQQSYNKLAPGKIIELNLSKGLFVSLPEQWQCYFLCETRALEGCVVSSVPFTHPSHVPPLLAALRQQALFNALVASCVRLQTKQVMELESVLMFEVSALSWQHISISLEHPLDESMATVELELSDPAAPRASVYTLNSPPRDHIDDYITKVLQKSHSIPITLRSLIKIWEREAASRSSYSALESNFSCGLGGIDPGGDVKHEPGTMHGRALYPTNVSHPHQGGTYLSEQQHHLSMMCQDSNTNESKTQITEDRKSKKRKSDTTIWPSNQKKGKPGMNDMMDSDSESDNSEAFGNDDNTMNSNSTNDDIEGRESSVSQNEFASDLELSGMDATDAIGGQDNRTSSDMDNSNDGDVEDIIRNSFHKSEHKRQKLKNKEDSRSGRSTSSLLLDLTDGKSYMPSSVSITPIGSSSSNPASSGSGSNISSMLCLDRRPGIEIIPITAAAPAALPSSITITPITSSQVKSLDDRIRSDKKSSKSGEERSKEKKKKRRRDDSMGPPEKIPPKQDPLTKPVSVSIKPTDGSPMRPTSPNSILRKFSPSPTHGRSVSITKSPSPSSVKGIGKPSGTSSHHSSPRHSPVQNSPKHLPGYSSPKNHSISSPKHSSSGSGKPSMSALKSAASGSPSGKSGTTGYDLSKKLSKESYSSSSVTSRDKEKKHSSLSFSSSDRSSPKLKNPLKLKQLEITPVSCDSPVTEPLISPPNIEVNKSNAPSQARNRKGSLSAVIDKLKSAQHCGTDSEITVKSSSSSSSSSKFSDPKNNASNSNLKVNESKNPEYMVKPSLDGMKITINKTRSKESSGSSKLNYSSSSSSKQSSPQLTPPSQGSPKTHTGLKPGVISGPASKKTQVMQSSKSTSLSSSSTPPKANMSPSEQSGSSNSSNNPKVPYSKSISNSAGINLSKTGSKSSSGSPKSSSADLAKIIRDREREKARTKLMSNSEKSIFSSKSERHSSPSSSRDDVDGDRFKNTSKDANFLVEGLIKPLDTSKFQIPKLKNQNTPDKSSPVSQYDSRSMVNDFARSMDQGKYSFSHFDNPNRGVDSIQKSVYPLNVPKPLLNLGGLSPKTIPPGKTDQSEYSKAVSDSISKGGSPQRSKDDSKEGYSASYPLMPLDYKTDMAKGFPAPKGSSEDRKGADSCMKPPASGSVARSGATTPQEAAEMLLDFSSSSGSKVSGMVAVRPVYPASPALLQLAKSPAPSPLVAPSPHSNSPCITDDELMDEALVGPGK